MKTTFRIPRTRYNLINQRSLKSIFCLISYFFLICSCFSNEKIFKSLENQKWLLGPDRLGEPYTWFEAAEFYLNNPGAERCWASGTKPNICCDLIYTAEWGRIWSMGFFYNLDILFVRDVLVPNFDENDFVLIPFWGEAEFLKGKINLLLKHAKKPENFFFLANSLADAKMLNEEIGVQAFGISHNAFIDADVFYPKEEPKLYDAIYLGCCRSQKRLELGKNIFSESIVVTDAPEGLSDLDVLPKKTVISPPIESFASTISQAHCGVIFSSSEGGCYASTEYLLCGIPVVSTHSIGGRDAYYDDVTAIVVNSDPDEISKAVQAIKDRKIDPFEIRNRAILVSEKMLNTLAYDILQPIFTKYLDPWGLNPREFVDKKIKESQKKSSKGRTVFQPEGGEYNTLRKIIQAQRISHPNKILSSTKLIKKIKLIGAKS
jgi:hypothetical protein